MLATRAPLSYILAEVLAGLTPLIAASIVAGTDSVVWVVVLLVACAVIAFPTALVGRRPQPVQVTVD
ncbi:hypothetical protein [Amycolatopsis granulosa]|uniref:hypothetical protein n=1 Tax=Amycolatopsis granulosa TaxID=185684 RepID=UPI0014226A9A|nr:hypothetical protein [Amycolatopsis granulosa]NIH84701.1 hypothetical protein [Amycolatopsis granulosa]